MTVHWFVPGDPKPQGSKNYFVGDDGQARGRESCKGLGPWRKAVATCALFHLPNPRPVIASGPVGVVLDFRMAKGKDAPGDATTKPDIDKLTRACLDALTGLAWKDDSQVTDVHASKQWAGDEGPGVYITVRGWQLRASQIQEGA